MAYLANAVWRQIVANVLYQRDVTWRLIIDMVGGSEHRTARTLAENVRGGVYAGYYGNIMPFTCQITSLN